MRPKYFQMAGGARWESGSFDILAGDNMGNAELTARDGYIYAGLGLFLIKANAWSLTHLGSGLRICRINKPPSGVFAAATQIAELGNWTFGGTVVRDVIAAKALAIIKADPDLSRGDDEPDNA